MPGRKYSPEYINQVVQEALENGDFRVVARRHNLSLYRVNHWVRNVQPELKRSHGTEYIRGWWAWIGIKETVFALFLNAGLFKADPRLAWFPLDLTLLTGLVTAGLVGYELIKRGFQINKNIILVLLFFHLFLPSLFWTNWYSYAIEKTLYFYTLTLLATIAPMFLIQTRNDLYRFFNAFFLLGAIMAIDALFKLITSSGLQEQMTAFGSDTIALGRTVGIALLWLAVLMLAGRVNFLAGLGGLCALGIVLFSSGSRGPILTVFACLGIDVFFNRLTTDRVVRLVALLLVISLFLILSTALAPQMSQQRVLNFLQGNLGPSELNRLIAYKLSWASIKEYPFGVGMGGFATVINLWSGQTRQYPHNIILETFLEGGVLACFYLLFMTGLAFQCCFRLRQKWPALEWNALMAILFFNFVNALVSGDFNDNRVFFAFIGLAIGLIRQEKRNGLEI